MTGEKEKEVHIKADENRQLQVADVRISKHDQQKVKWVSDIDQTATLTFAESPFKKGGQKFTVEPNDKTNSGPIDRDAKHDGKEYKYDVTAPTYKDLDPNVIVDP